MYNWIPIEATNDATTEFNKEHECFHDHRIENIFLDYKEDAVIVWLKYDDRKNGVKLRFQKIYAFKSEPFDDYPAAWLLSTWLLVLPENGHVAWTTSGYDEGTLENLEDARKFGTWIEAGSVSYVLTDYEGNQVDKRIR